MFGNLNLHRRELGRQINLPQTTSFKSGQPVLWDSETIQIIIKCSDLKPIGLSLTLI